MRAFIEKWSPAILQRFERIVRQNQLGHAYLFSGDSARFELAIWLSQSLFCESKQDGLPCERCRNCQLIAKEEFADVTVVRPQGKIIKTETIRELVKQFSQSGFESKRQAFIICEAEKMHTNAANSLLKVIEEPQSESVVFLLTNQEEWILPTIRSRTQLVSFPKNLSVFQETLEKEGVLKREASLLAELCSTKEEALKLLGNKAFQELLPLATKFVNAWQKGQKEAYLMVGQLASLTTDKHEQERLLDLLTILVSKDWSSRYTEWMLEGLLEARQLWMSNVSLQNALEYIFLKDRRKRENNNG